MSELQGQQAGSGPLLEREYWAILDSPRVGPSELADELAERFEAFPPPELVRFRRRAEGRLTVGDELDVEIVGAGTFGVRVIHRDEGSITLGTLEGHPEAGRITFGAYLNHRRDVVFHIRSRARASSRNRYLGFLFAGDPMQTNTWSDFINRLAALLADGVRGAIHAEKRVVQEEPGDRSMDRPTFIARGD
jgi:hypothetical protein